MGMKVVVPVGVGCDEYCYCVRVVFGCKSCPVEGLLCVCFCMRVSISVPYPFMLERGAYGPEYCISKVGRGELG